jgi:hypothetical protein
MKVMHERVAGIDVHYARRESPEQLHPGCTV